MTEPDTGSLPVNEPALLPEFDAVQDVALAEVQVNWIARPKLMVAGCAGAVNDTLGVAGGGGGGMAGAP